MYLGELLNTIRPFGLRGAFENNYVVDDLAAEDAAEKRKAEALFRRWPRRPLESALRIAVYCQRRQDLEWDLMFGALCGVG